MKRIGKGVRSQIAIGVIGARDMVERMMMVAGQMGGDWRLVGSAYSEEHEARDRLMKIEGSIDVCLFAGPLPYDLAREGGDLPVPATYVPISGAALYSTLLRGALQADIDPARVSVDSVSPTELAEAYSEIGLATDGVHVSPYSRPESAREFYSFHERLYRDGATSGALTTVPTVSERLSAAGVPVLRMIPTAATLRIALHTAALLGTGSRLEESQIAIAFVEVAKAARAGYAGPSNYWQQELKLALHRVLLHEARLMGATVLPRDEHGYLVIATLGSLARATSDFRVAPFLQRVAEELGVAVDVGIGLGRTAASAETHAQLALDKARTIDTPSAFVIDSDDHVLELPAVPHRRAASLAPETVEEGPEGPPGEDAGTLAGAPAAGAATKGHEILARLQSLLAGEGTAPDNSTPLVVDAERVAEVLGVTPRTARRVLHTLVAEGLAWPMPPARPVRAGRPRQPYRLVTEKLDNAG